MPRSPLDGILQGLSTPHAQDSDPQNVQRPEGAFLEGGPALAIQSSTFSPAETQREQLLRTRSMSRPHLGRDLHLGRLHLGRDPTWGGTLLVQKWHSPVCP